MLNVLPPYADSNVEIISKKGIITIFPIFILVVVVIALAYRFNQIHRTTDKEDLLELAFTIVCVNFIIFSLYKVGYGNHIFEERYLISTYLFVILIVGAYISRLDIAQVFSKMVILILLLGVIGTNIFSDYNGATLLVVNKNDNCVPEEIMNQYTLEKDIGWGYIYKCDYNPISIRE